MNNRIIQFLTDEKISPAQFADTIGVQRSNISHIISGRNKPSAEFIEKMLRAYPYINAEWLILGTEPMYKDDKPKSQNNAIVANDGQLSLLSEQAYEVKNEEKEPEKVENKEVTSDLAVEENKTKENDFKPEEVVKAQTQNRVVERVIICYSDKTFEFYLPE